MAKDEKAATFKTATGSDNATEVAGNNTKNSNSMNLNDYSFGTESAIRTNVEYDNQSAVNELVSMMERRELLTVKPYTNRVNKLCMLVESRHVSSFTVQVNKYIYQGLFNYLFKGEVMDGEVAPMQTDTVEERIEFQEVVMKRLIEAGKTLQYVPMFREQPEYLCAILPCLKGKVILRVKRSEELMDYLRENQQII